MNAPRIFITTKKVFSKVLPELNENNIYAEGIDNYIDKKHLATTIGIPKASSISAIYVNEERANRTPHNLLQYNTDYTRIWGQQHVYGNVVVIVGDKTFNEIDSPLKVSMEQKDTITL